jgi:hypothetical protein
MEDLGDVVQKLLPPHNQTNSNTSNHSDPTPDCSVALSAGSGDRICGRGRRRCDGLFGLKFEQIGPLDHEIIGVL